MGKSADKIFERIKLALKAKTQNDVAEALGISQGGVGGALKEDKIPATWYVTLCFKHNINPKWLLTGEGPMRLEEKNYTTKDSDFKYLSEHWAELPIDKRAEIMNIIKDGNMDTWPGEEEAKEHGEPHSEERAEFIQKTVNEEVGISFEAYYEIRDQYEFRDYLSGKINDAELYHAYKALQLKGREAYLKQMRAGHTNYQAFLAYHKNKKGSGKSG